MGFNAKNSKNTKSTKETTQSNNADGNSNNRATKPNAKKGLFGNNLVKIVGAGIVLLIVVSLFSGGKEDKRNTNIADLNLKDEQGHAITTLNALSQDWKMGVEGINALKTQQQKDQATMKALKMELVKLSDQSQGYSHSGSPEIARLQQQIESLKADQEKTRDTLKAATTGSSNQPYRTNTATTTTVHGNQSQARQTKHVAAPLTDTPDIGLVSLEKDKSGHVIDPDNPLTPDVIGRNDSGKSFHAKETKEKAIPYYRIPEGSTIPDARLMTNIVAEVPVDGQLVEQPYPFKAIVTNKALLASRGIKLPTDLKGIVLDGYTWGSSQLACARGYVTGMLFNWADGTYTYVGKSMTNNKRFDFNPDVLGTIGTENGNLCIPGIVTNNAAPIITNLSLMGAASKGGQALANANQSQLVNGAGTIEVTKNVTNTIAGGFISGAADKADNWYERQIGNYYNIVYIPAAKGDKVATISVYINKTVKISKNPEDRIVYAHSGQGEINESMD